MAHPNDPLDVVNPNARPDATAAVGALMLALAGASLMAWGFVAGIDAALNGAGSGAGVFEFIFLLGFMLSSAALVIGVVGLVRRKAKALNIAAIALAVAPGLTATVVLLVARF